MQQSGGNTDVLLFRYFGYKRTLRTFKYVKNKGFFIENNEFKNLYLKWHVQRSGVPMRKKKKKNTSNQVRRHENVFQSKFVRLFYKNHGLGEKHRTICSLIFLG